MSRTIGLYSETDHFFSLLLSRRLANKKGLECGGGYLYNQGYFTIIDVYCAIRSIKNVGQMPRGFASKRFENTFN